MPLFDNLGQIFPPSYGQSIIIGAFTCLISATVFSFPGEKTVARASEARDCLGDLVSMGGGGSWPPRSLFGEDWPPALRPFHDILRELCRELAVEVPSLYDETNRRRIFSFRFRMTKELNRRVDLSAFASATSGLSPASCNGFFACIALSRHAYRWGVVPVVTVAQEEELVRFPEQLEVAWQFLQQYFGVSSSGGCVTSNFLCNFNVGGEMVYQITKDLSQIHSSAEYHFSRIFVAMEEYALPIYTAFVEAISHMEQDESRLCLESLRTANELLKKPLKHFFTVLNEPSICKREWLGYVQGFHAWAAGEEISGEYVEYDGLSGGQSLLIMSIDAFLGIPQYFSEEKERLYVPAVQRRWLRLLRRYSFREIISGREDLESEVNRMVAQMRLFRMGHLARVMPYLNAPAPERKKMTAGRSSLESNKVDYESSGIAYLEGVMKKRLQDTK